MRLLSFLLVAEWCVFVFVLAFVGYKYRYIYLDDKCEVNHCLLISVQHVLYNPHFSEWHCSLLCHHGMLHGQSTGAEETVQGGWCQCQRQRSHHQGGGCGPHQVSRDELCVAGRSGEPQGFSRVISFALDRVREIYTNSMKPAFIVYCLCNP